MNGDYPSQQLRDQIEFLFNEHRTGLINIHELMHLIDMAYKDYLDFHPAERDFCHDAKQQYKSQKYPTGESA